MEENNCKRNLQNWEKLSFYQQNLSLGALLDFQPTLKGNVFFGQKWIKFSLATHRNLLL
jgi:hypothetical protein